MTNLLTRLTNTIKSDFSKETDHKDSKHPIAVLNHYLSECEKEVDKVGQIVERQRMLKLEFTKELQSAKSMVQKREEHVRLAEEAGESELAALARHELTHYQSRKERLELSVVEVTNQLQGLEKKHGDMKQKLKDMYIKRLEAMGRENVVRANENANRVLADDDQSIEEKRFSDIERHLQQIETGEVNRQEEQTIDQQITQLQKRMGDSKAEAGV
ncbi:PspA/IM30 family protein [Jeotgalibacillus marinus]|uniref:PspA/IM30 family protein n=1 Tax=Jeotgalibacillus marinus TaxID=86667 RepID=A0ABV3Q4J2_9BACL